MDFIITEWTEGTLTQVENVFEKSILIEIGTQIKLKQNKRYLQSRTQILSQKFHISQYFCHDYLVLAAEFESMKNSSTCNICWIVERGIRVLALPLGLVIPSVILIVLNRATKDGIPIRNNRVFEKYQYSQKRFLTTDPPHLHQRIQRKPDFI